MATKCRYSQKASPRRTAPIASPESQVARIVISTRALSTSSPSNPYMKVHLANREAQTLCRVRRIRTLQSALLRRPDPRLRHAAANRHSVRGSGDQRAGCLLTHAAHQATLPADQHDVFDCDQAVRDGCDPLHRICPRTIPSYTSKTNKPPSLTQHQPALHTCQPNVHK